MALNKSYSNLDYSTDAKIKYHDLVISGITKANRDKIYLPNFTKFSWRGYDSFDNFGCFITSKQGELKFYNGPSYSNQYTKPQFENSNGNLTGLSFSAQKISFNIAVYWITEEHYRHFIDWLNPYVIDELSFDFDSDYHYLVKLSGIKDSPRYIVGHDVDGQPAYYTEMTLEFEVQGEQCAIGKNYEWEDFERTEGSNYFTSKLNTSGLTKPSMLDTPIDFEVELNNGEIGAYDELEIRLDLVYDNSPSPSPSIELFDLFLQNFTIDSGLHTFLRYDSDSGIMFIKFGDTKEKLLNLRYATTEGKKIVKSLNIQKYKIPGIFTAPTIDYTKLQFKLTINGLSSLDVSGSVVDDVLGEYGITIRQRTNLI